MKISENIKSLVSMREIAEYYGFTPNRSGFICCPFHTEKTASLKIYPDGRGYYCFGCGAGGDSINFVMRLFDLTFKDAVVKINGDFGLGLDTGGGPSLRQAREAAAKLEAKKAKRTKHDKLIADYDAAMSEWCKLDHWKRVYEPKTPNDPIDDRYIQALTGLETARFNYDEAERKLREYELK